MWLHPNANAVQPDVSLLNLYWKAMGYCMQGSSLGLMGEKHLKEQSEVSPKSYQKLEHSSIHPRRMEQMGKERKHPEHLLSYTVIQGLC